MDFGIFSSFRTSSFSKLSFNLVIVFMCKIFCEVEVILHSLVT